MPASRRPSRWRLHASPWSAALRNRGSAATERRYRRTSAETRSSESAEASSDAQRSENAYDGSRLPQASALKRGKFVDHLEKRPRRMPSQTLPEAIRKLTRPQGKRPPYRLLRPLATNRKYSPPGWSITRRFGSKTRRNGTNPCRSTATRRCRCATSAEPTSPATPPHGKQHMLAGEGSGHHSEVRDTVVGYETVHHGAEGHWERVESGGHWE